MHKGVGHFIPYSHRLRTQTPPVGYGFVTESPAPLPPPSKPARLVRSRENRILGGVCAGLANYLGMDVTLVRILAVVLAFAAGTAILAYIAGWIIIPEARPEEEVVGVRADVSDRVPMIIGAILIVGGALWLLSSLLPWVLDFRGIGPLILVAIGVLLVVQGSKR
jgi:phage shock protein C